MSVVDLSRYQGIIPIATLRAWKAAGVTRVVLKAGGADDGVYKDADHDTNAAYVRAVGLGVDHYWFNGPGDASHAATFLAYANGKPGDRYWLDCESEGSMVHDTPSVALEFTNYVRAHAPSPDVVGIYMSSSVTGEADWAANAAVDALWVANYGANTGTPGTTPGISYWKTYTYWQYTSVGHLPDYAGSLDLSKEGAAVTTIQEDDLATQADANLIAATLTKNTAFLEAISLHLLEHAINNNDSDKDATLGHLWSRVNELDLKLTGAIANVHPTIDTATITAAITAAVAKLQLDVDPTTLADALAPELAKNLTVTVGAK